MADSEDVGELGTTFDGKPMRIGVHGTGVIQDNQGQLLRLFHSPFEEEMGEEGKFLDKLFGPCETVFNSSSMGCHSYVYKPTEKHPCHTVVSMGLAGFRMPVPQSLREYVGAEYTRTELCVCLPPSWQMPSILGADELDSQNWAMELMLSLCNYVVSNSAHFKHNDGMPGNPLSGTEPLIEGSQMTCCMLRHPLHLGNTEDVTFTGENPYTQENENVEVLMVIPLTTEEYQYRRNYGSDALWELMEKEAESHNRLPYVCDPNRASVV